MTSRPNKMAASTGLSKGAAISKSDYLKRYLSNDDDVKKSKEKKIRKKRLKPSGKGMKIVDDDIDWRQLTAQSEKENKDEDEDDAPVIAEIIDERPDEVKQLEAFRSSNKWKVLGATADLSLESQDPDSVTSSGVNRINAARHDSPDSSPVRRVLHPSPDHSPKRRVRCDSPDLSPQRNDSPDVSPPRQRAETKHRRLDSPSPSPPRKNAKSLPPKTQKQLHKDSPNREKSKSSSRRRVSDSDLSPRQRRPNARRDSDSDLSPPRKQSKGGKGSDSDLSPPRKTSRGRHGSDSDLSPPRQRHSPAAATGPRMLSGGTAGLVSVDMLRKEKENVGGENQNRLLEEESRGAATVFRGKGKLKREEEIRKAKEKAVQDEKYAQWGKGLAQAEMQQQNIEDAIREAQKPLARHIDDQDLDKMLREQERDGDPMAGLLRKKKEKSAKGKGVKERPRYQGPVPPPNRFSIMPGYRWDGVDRSNGFEQKHFSRMADKKAVQEEAYKWSVEDM